MASLDNGVDFQLIRAKKLHELGDHIQALELYRSALARMDKEDPRREEILSAIAYLQVSTALAVEPGQLLIWRRFTRWVLARRKARWAVVGVLVLLELGLFLSRRTSFDARTTSGAEVLNDLPVPTELLQTPVIELALAPTPLAPLPTETPSPTFFPTPTPTILPTLTPTPSPTFTPFPTLVPPSRPSNSAQGSAPASSPAPTVAPAPKPAPVPTSTSGNTGPGSGGGSTGGTTGPGPGGGGKGNGNGGGGGKGKHK